MDNKNNDILLNYIDKLWDTLIATNKQFNTLIALQVIISLILISLSSGIVSVDERYNLLGMNFSSTPWVILLGGILFINFSYFYTFTLIEHARGIRNEIKKKYKEIGYPNISSTKIDRSYIVQTRKTLNDIDKAKSKTDKFLAFPTLFAMVLSIIILPLVAIEFSTLQLLKLSHAHLIYYPIFLTIMPYIPLSYLIYKFRLDRKLHESNIT